MTRRMTMGKGKVVQAEEREHTCESKLVARLLYPGDPGPSV